MHERSDIVNQYADQLRQHATHFVQSDWKYTRKDNLRHIRKVGDYSGYDAPWRRVCRWLDDYVPWRRDNPTNQLGMRWFAWRHPIIHATVSLRTESHRPDGVLDNGLIITYWEETGEYLQYVQPSVGEMLADWMDADPDSPHAQRIAAEMKRINDDYGVRSSQDAA